MPTRSLQYHASLPTRLEISWLTRRRNDHRPLTMQEMLIVEKIINCFELPCSIETIADVTSLHIFTRNAETNSPNERPIPILSIRDSQVPRGNQYHPRLGTLGKAWLTRLALNGINMARCKVAGIHPGSLRPGLYYHR